MRMRNLLAISALVTTPAAAQTTLETISIWDGSSGVTPFGKLNTATYGQTFTVPGSDNLLQSFSFFLTDLSSGGDLRFQGYIAKWDTGIGALTGPLLFQSAIQNGPAPGAGFTRYDFDVGGLPLTSGDVYLAFLSTSGLFANIPIDQATASVGVLQTNVDGGIGTFRFNNSGDVFSSLFLPSSWQMQDRDLAFEAVFDNVEPSVVPEPSTVLLLGTGLGILLLGVRRGRRRV